MLLSKATNAEYVPCAYRIPWNCTNLSINVQLRPPKVENFISPMQWHEASTRMLFQLRSQMRPKRMARMVQV